MDLVYDFDGIDFGEEYKVNMKGLFGRGHIPR